MKIVDTSVVIKWLFREKYSDAALQLLINEKQFYAPGYIRTGMFSGITKKVRAGFIDVKDSRKLIRKFEHLPLHFIPNDDLQYLAFEISTKHPITFYDAIFIAAAIDRKTNFYTYDFRLKRSVQDSVFEEIIRIPL